MCEVEVCFTGDGKEGTEHIDINDFDPQHHRVVGEDISVYFTADQLEQMPKPTKVAICRACTLGDLERLAGKPQSAIDPGEDKPVVWLTGSMCWFPKKFLASAPKEGLATRGARQSSQVARL